MSGIHGRLGFDTPDIAFGEGATADAACGLNERRTVRVVSHSSLTNAGELRALLESRGHAFDTESDAELLAHAYEEWGPRAVARLRGPFACAVWDAEARCLVLARDHIGLRRLYYALVPGGLAFASQIQLVFPHHAVGREWSAEAIDAYLALGYVPAPLTAYRRISKLEPAQLVQVDGRRLHLETYWDVPAAAPVAVALDERLATLDARLRTVLRQPTGVTPGLLYSGSTASTVLLSATTPGGTIPITVDVEEDASDLTRSESAATWLGHSRQLELAAPDAITLAAAFASCVHEPIADPAAIVQVAVLHAARRHGVTAFAAHGGSLLWAGRAPHQVDRANGRVTDVRHLQRVYSCWDGQLRRGIYTREFSWQLRDADPFSRHLALHASHPSDDALERGVYVALRTSLADGGLLSADCAAAAAGVSLRLPFLDRDLVVLAATTPSTVKRRGFTGLHALRRLLLRRLPRTLVPPARRPIVQHDWLRGALAAMVPAVLLVPRFDGRGIVSRVVLRQLWAQHRRGHVDHAQHLWSLLMLEFWFRQCVDGEAAGEPLEYAVLKAVA